jgi:hypothetical protein
MAGVLLPTWFLLVILLLFLTAQSTHLRSVGIERVIAFPMAVVPNLWGLWNVLYVALRSRYRIPIGVFGALLPPLLGILGLQLLSLLDARFFSWREALMFLPIAMAVYFLVWKFGVGFLNRVVDV